MAADIRVRFERASNGEESVWRAILSGQDKAEIYVFATDEEAKAAMQRTANGALDLLEQGMVKSVKICTEAY